MPLTRMLFTITTRLRFSVLSRYAAAAFSHCRRATAAYVMPGMLRRYSAIRCVRHYYCWRGDGRVKSRNTFFWPAPCRDVVVCHVFAVSHS